MSRIKLLLDVVNGMRSLADSLEILSLIPHLTLPTNREV